MNTKHTPGPWDVDSHGNIVQGPGRYKIAITSATSIADRSDGADARLIAAAPELLEALKDLVSQLPEMDADQPLPGADAVDVLCFVWPKIKAAIAKAEVSR